MLTLSRSFIFLFPGLLMVEGSRPKIHIHGCARAAITDDEIGRSLVVEASKRTLCGMVKWIRKMLREDKLQNYLAA